MKTMEQIRTSQEHFFSTGKTKEYAFRLFALKRLRRAILDYKKELEQALLADLNKAPQESYMTEIGLALEEITYAIRHLKEWVKPSSIKTPLSCFPGKSFTRQEPYGITLIMSPWNYPFLLTIAPLVGAIGAGNCCIVKPSAYSPKTSRVMHKLLAQAFPQKYVAVVEGGRAENNALLEQRFDYIFFTGSVAVGKLVMEKASHHLTPVTLELGGKSPCIVDETANLKLAAKRLVFGKFLNSGQTCVAPDYLLIQDTVKEAFLQHVSYWIRNMYGNLPLCSQEYPRIVSEKHYDRLMGLMKGEQIRIGGYGNRKTLQIAPTVLDGITSKSPIMQEEIFGPLLPVLTFHDLSQAEGYIRSQEKPLALYLFSQNKKNQERVLTRLSFGGGCINDTIMHLSSPRFPFGGVGSSGMGSYHGKASFTTFSHQKTILSRGSFPDVSLRYHPYTWVKKTLIHIVG